MIPDYGGYWMIDKLCLRCDFAKVFHFGKGMSYPDIQLSDLGIPLEISLNRDGIETNIRHPWESIPSSYAGLAFKVFDYRCTGLEAFYIEIKASPAKLMYGHNIYGSSNFKECALFMIDLLKTVYPRLFDYLASESWTLSDIDITYFSKADSDTLALQFINALQNVSYGQTKSRNGHHGTAYFGSVKSRLKRLKVYGKHQEVLKTIADNQLKKNGGDEDGKKNAMYTAELLQFTQGMVRWESTLFHRWLDRRGIDCDLNTLLENDSLSPKNLIALWQQSNKDVFKSLEGLEMTTITDENVQQRLREKFFKVSEKTGKTSYAIADAAYRTYRIIQIDGWDIAKASISKPTFYRHVSALIECGLSRASLQSLQGNGLANVVPFYRFIGVDFGAQLPSWVEEDETGSLYLKNGTENR